MLSNLNEMKNLLICTTVLSLLLITCTRKQEQKNQKNFAPKVIEATGYIVPKDSMAMPKVILVDISRLAKTPARKVAIIPANTNVHVAGAAKIILAGGD